LVLVGQIVLPALIPFLALKLLLVAVMEVTTPIGSVALVVLAVVVTVLRETLAVPELLVREVMVAWASPVVHVGAVAAVALAR
jgi:hypothetical protein